ncbi:MAG: conjugal transfer protein TrbI, partial [Rhodobacterales bacterium]
GLEDRVDYHGWDLLRAAGLSTLLAIGAEIGAQGDDPLVAAIREGTQSTIGDVGQEIVRRQIDRPPTLTIRPGYPLRVVVTRDLILEPYRP